MRYEIYTTHSHDVCTQVTLDDLAVRLPKHNVKTHISAADKDGDGSLDFEEWVAYLLELSSKSTQLLEDLLDGHSETMSRTPSHDSVQTPAANSSAAKGTVQSVAQVVGNLVGNPIFRANATQLKEGTTTWPPNLTFKEFAHNYRNKVYYSGASYVPDSRIVHEYDEYMERQKGKRKRPASEDHADPGSPSKVHNWGPGKSMKD